MPKNSVKLFAGVILLILAISSGWIFRWDLYRSFIAGDQALLITPNTLNLGEWQADTKVPARFRLTNLSSSDISIDGVHSGCGCITHQKLPLVIKSHETTELNLDLFLESSNSAYDQVATFMVAEDNILRQYPVRIVAQVRDPLPTPANENPLK